MPYRVLVYTVAALLVAALSVGGANPALADKWLAGAPADEPIALWVKDVDRTLNQQAFWDLFSNDPRSPMAPMMHLFNRAAQAWQDKHPALAKDYVRQAFGMLDEGVRKAYYSEADIAPVREAILAWVPQELGGKATGKPSQERLIGAKPAAVTSPEERFSQQLGHPLGVPLPGTVGDIEETKKRPDLAKADSPEQAALVTLGSSKYLFYGTIRKIEGQYYVIQDEESGDVVRLAVSRDTHFDCARPDIKAAIDKRAEVREPKATEEQVALGQRPDETAMGTGFRIGPEAGCTFKAGDVVKAEVSDLGVATFIKLASADRSPGYRLMAGRAIGKSAGTGQLALAEQGFSGQLDMTGATGYPPKRYAIDPVPLGKVELVSQDPFIGREVTDSRGNKIGKIHSLIRDSETNQIQYAEIWLASTQQVAVAPWAAFSQTKAGPLFASTDHFQLEPVMTARDFEDRSPAEEHLVKLAETAVGPLDLMPAKDRAKFAAREKVFRPTPKMFTSGKVVRGRIVDADWNESKLVIEEEGTGKEMLLHMDYDAWEGYPMNLSPHYAENEFIESYLVPGKEGELAVSVTEIRQPSWLPDGDG